MQTHRSPGCICSQACNFPWKYVVMWHRVALGSTQAERKLRTWWHLADRPWLSMHCSMRCCDSKAVGFGPFSPSSKFVLEQEGVPPNGHPGQPLLSAPNGPPTGWYPPDIASQPLYQPPVTAFATNPEYRFWGTLFRIPCPRLGPFPLKHIAAVRLPPRACAPPSPLPRPPAVTVAATYPVRLTLGVGSTKSAYPRTADGDGCSGL